MRLLVGVLACMSVGAISIAMADPPPPASSTATAPAATSVPAAPAAAAKAAAPAADAEKTSVVVQSTPEVDPLEKHFLAEGYKMEMRNGEKVFCRREEELGSRLGGRKVCSTAQQLDITERTAKASVNRSSMQQNNPTGH
jgi:hypothetical protein